MSSSVTKRIVPSKVVVFIDIPDPDNILLALDVAKSHPQEHISIVLSARIVDLSVPRYGHDFSAIKQHVSLREMAIPIDSDKAYDVPKHLKRWFYKDANLSDANVQTDTIMYMNASSLRIAQVFQIYGISPARYTIFWNPNSLKTITRPDMRHAFHVHDFKYNFNENEIAAYEKIVSQNRVGGLDLRIQLRSLIHQYTLRQIGELGLQKSDDKLQDLRVLIKANNKVEHAKLFIGGPFTEALLYIQRAARPELVIAMAFSKKLDRTFMEMQFNEYKDPKAAKTFCKLVEDEKIKMRITPTECVKGTQQEPCPYQFELCEYEEILGKDSLLFGMIQRYKSDTDRLDTYSAFDWVSGITGTDPGIFKWSNVKLQKRREGGTGMVVKKLRHSEVKMARDDYKYMHQVRSRLLERMRQTVETKDPE